MIYGKERNGVFSRGVVVDDVDRRPRKEDVTMERKKTIDKFSELREKYDVNRLRETLEKTLKSDVSGKTTARVQSYYVVDPTPDSPEILDPNERESNVVAADVTRAFQFAPEELRFDHTFSFKDRDEDQEKDRSELLRVDEYRADAYVGTNLRLIQLLDSFLEVDPLIYHKFVSCSSLDVRKRDEQTVYLKNLFKRINSSDKDLSGTDSYTVAQLVEIASDLFYLSVPYKEIYNGLSNVVSDVELVKEILTKGENRTLQMRNSELLPENLEYCRALQALGRLRRRPWLQIGYVWENYLKNDDDDNDALDRFRGGIIDDKSGMSIIHTNAYPEVVLDGLNRYYTERRLQKIVADLLYSGFRYENVLKELVKFMGDKDKAEKMMEEGRKQYAQTFEERRLMLLDGTISEKEEEGYKERLGLIR